MKTTIPFAGFYYSIHNSNLDDAVEQMFSDDHGNVNEKLSERVQMECNWSKVFKEYAEAYCENFALHFKLSSLKFEDLDSPKYYNFSTDRVFAEIDLSEVVRIVSEIELEDFLAHAKEKFTSRDGFSSFYSNDVADWGPVKDWDHNQVGTLIEFYVSTIEEDFDSYKENDLMEDDRGNGAYESWISEATPNIERLYKISEYLRDRAKR
jgi:hypothetical protein